MKTTDSIGDLVSCFAKGGVFTTSGFRGEVKRLDEAGKMPAGLGKKMVVGC